jgi:hypothetical protein
VPSKPVSILLSGLMLAAAAAAQQAPPSPNSFSIPRARRDTPLSVDPAAPFWAKAASVATSHDRYGKPVAGARTEIRGVWSRRYLYLLFVSQFDKLKLKPNPSKKKRPGGSGTTTSWKSLSVAI